MNRDAAIQHMIKQLQSETAKGHIDIVIPKFMAHRIIAYQSMREDFRTVRKLLKVLLESELDPIIKASTWYSTIALYGRCFTDAEESKFPKLEAVEVFSKEESYQATHQKIMDLRHKFVAHRGETDNEVSISFMRIYFDQDGRDIIVRQMRQNKPSKELLESLLKILDYLIPIVEEKYGKAAKKISKSMLTNFSAEELIKLSV